MRSVAEAALAASTCTRCALSGTRTQVVYGAGDENADLMFIGEAPGFNEDQRGIPFVGAAGQLLDKLLVETGIERSDVYISNTVLCRPPGNRDPRPEETEACRPWLDERIDIVDPAVIVTLGNWATRYALGPDVSISRVRGQRFPWHDRTVIPTFHPAAVLHGGGVNSRQMAQMREDFAEIKLAMQERRALEAPVVGVPQLEAVAAAQEQLGLF
jgi:uracil-DNA glycosylase family 4